MPRTPACLRDVEFARVFTQATRMYSCCCGFSMLGIGICGEPNGGGMAPGTPEPGMGGEGIVRFGSNFFPASFSCRLQYRNPVPLLQINFSPSESHAKCSKIYLSLSSL